MEKLWTAICGLARFLAWVGGAMSEIYQEGLRIPVMRLYRRGELDAELFELLLLNMRLPAERRGDLNAQIAACRLGVERMLRPLSSNTSTPLKKMGARLMGS